MEKIQNYTIIEKIAETRGSLIYRCRRDDKTKTVVIKALKTMYPSSSEIARFKQEFEMIKSLNLDGIIKTYEIISHDGGFALVLEDFEGVSIKHTLEHNAAFDVAEFLKIAITIAGTLGGLHLKEIVHKDIKPHNILINREKQVVKITDFGISAVLTHENDEVYNPEFISGTLSYMSPEQTGRINRAVDYRTDLYSFGVTLYEMLTGSVPFRSKDPLEIIHSHIAVMPDPPAERNPAVPEAVSEIIMHLMAKTPEERYQNGFGAMADLAECLKRLEADGRIGRFDIGRHDISNKFIIPQKLFGREQEIKLLMSSFEDIAGSDQGAALMVVSGAPGIGKSAIINEIHKPVVARRGYFISGKYEQFRSDKPYSAIMQAYQGLIRQILAESDEMIRAWKNNLLNVLGDSGKVIAEVIPEIELIIGRQPELLPLGPEESRNRFNRVFVKFTNLFPKKEHPVVLFLDDLHWADMASLQLIKKIVTSPDIRNFFLIVSFRDTEVNGDHSVTELIKELERKNIPVSRIALGPLAEGDIQDLIINFLKCSDPRGASLAALLRRKTGGNPFFVNQFLHTLYNNKMIRPDADLGWQWDIDSISRLQVTENLVDLMAEKIGRLPENARKILTICACVGNRFDLETLAAVRACSIEQALEDLTSAIREGLVSQLRDAYIFHHDRIQEAAYSLATDAEKGDLHYRIGKAALAASAGDARENKLFYIADQLNLGSEMIRMTAEREELALINLKAGKKAKLSAAYAPAFRYLQSGIALLGANQWKDQYDLALPLYSECIETAYLLGDYQSMDRLVESALSHIHSPMEKVKIHISRINALIAQENFPAAIATALPFLYQLGGIRIPKKPKRYHVAIEMVKSRITLYGKRTNDLLNQPRITDPRLTAAGKILSCVGQAAFYCNPNMLAMVMLKSVNMFSRHGSGPETAFGFTGYGLILAVGVWNFKAAMKFGKLALNLVNKLNIRSQLSGTIFVYNALIRHWVDPLKDTIEPLMEGYRIGIEIGDLNYAGFNLYFTEVHKLFSGMGLPELEQTMARNNKIIAGLKQKHIHTLQSLTWQAVLNIMGQCGDPLELTGTAIDAEKLLPDWKRADNRSALSVYWFIKLILYSLYGEYAMALEASDNFKKYMDAQQGVVINRYAVLLDSVSRLLTYKQASWLQKIKYRAQIRINQEKLRRWADSSPANTLHMYRAGEALCAWVLKKNIVRAKSHFESVLQTCKKSGDIIVEGCAADIAAFLYQSTGDGESAAPFMRTAYGCYSMWGATGLTDKLIKRHPELARAAAHAHSDSLADSTSGESTGLTEALDLSTVMKAAQALSGEIVLDKLLTKMMKIVIENAGAEKGYLVLEARGRLLVEAAGSVGGKTITVHESIPVESHEGLSASIVNYVARTGGTLILNDATTEGEFVSDPYVMKNKPRSVLCTAVQNRGRLSGILYLENNLSAGAFTPNRLELLNLLSSQIAISIDNAKLYENLEDKIRERTHELQKALDALETVNENLSKANWELEQANEQHLIDMKLAGNVQTAIFHPEPPPSEEYDIALEFKPMVEVSGDFYDFFRSGDRIDGVGIFDVSGHGISSGLLTLLARSIINRNFNSETERLGPVMENINRDLMLEIGNAGLYLTGILLRFRDGAIEYVNSGHPDLIIKSGKTNIAENVTGADGTSINGPFLGIDLLEEAFKSIRIGFEKGDCVLLYTDSLSETRNPSGEYYDEWRILQSLQNAPDGSAREILDYIMEQFYRFTRKKDKLSDDMTAIVIKKK